MKHAIPDAVLAQHIAILGKTGAGKTSTEKVVVEQVVAADFRVCVLDTIKSDWWGITSSADGKRPGLPFKILGGPRGHVPLHSSAGKVIGQLVGSGKLPLSIIDMADFEAGGIQRFFVDFAPALMRSAKGVLYLVIEEAHEVAPKERAGFGAENMAIHWAKKLATAGRSKGIRLIVATQRVQSLHNAVLGSCETIIAHRLTTPADQDPVLKWLKANTDKDTQEKVAASLSSLPTGTGWICSGEAKLFEQRAFPKFKTYDNTATPTGDTAEISVKTAHVDQDELREIIGDAVKQAEADDPKALRKRIAELEAAAKKPAQSVYDADAVSRASQAGFDRGYATGHRAAAADANKAVAAMQRYWDLFAPQFFVLQSAFKNLVDASEDQLAADLLKSVPPAADTVRPPSARIALPRATSSSGIAAGGDDSLPGPERRILNSLASWRAMGHDKPSNAQVAWLAAYSPTSSSYANPRGALKTKGLLHYPTPDHLELTADGGAVAVADPPADLRAFVLAQLPGPEARILKAAIDVYSDAASNEQIAEAAGYSATSSSYANPRGALKTKDLITYPSSGMVRAADWLFP